MTTTVSNVDLHAAIQRESVAMAADPSTAAGALLLFRRLLALLGPFRYDEAAIATLTGVKPAQVGAHQRLGHLRLDHGFVIGVRSAL